MKVEQLLLADLQAYEYQNSFNQFCSWLLHKYLKVGVIQCTVPETSQTNIPGKQLHDLQVLSISRQVKIWKFQDQEECFLDDKYLFWGASERFVGPETCLMVICTYFYVSAVVVETFGA